MAANRSRNNRHPKGQDGSSLLEWIAAVLSAFIVIGMLGWMTYEAVTESTAPPRIEIAITRTEETPGGYMVGFTASNSGSTTAAGLVVEGKLTDETGEVEVSTVTIDYVPPRADVKGGLFFSKDPHNYSLVVRPVGFKTL